MNLTDQIRAAIKARAVPAHQLEMHSGVSRANVGRFVAGERDVLTATAGKLLAALGCTVTVHAPPDGTPLVKGNRRRRAAKKGA